MMLRKCRKCIAIQVADWRFILGLDTNEVYKARKLAALQRFRKPRDGT